MATTVESDRALRRKFAELVLREMPDLVLDDSFGWVSFSRARWWDRFVASTRNQDHHPIRIYTEVETVTLFQVYKDAGEWQDIVIKVSDPKYLKPSESVAAAFETMTGKTATVVINY